MVTTRTDSGALKPVNYSESTRKTKPKASKTIAKKAKVTKTKKAKRPKTKKAPNKQTGIKRGKEVERTFLESPEGSEFSGSPYYSERELRAMQPRPPRPVTPDVTPPPTPPPPPKRYVANRRMQPNYYKVGPKELEKILNRTRPWESYWAPHPA